MREAMLAPPAGPEVAPPLNAEEQQAWEQTVAAFGTDTVSEQAPDRAERARAVASFLGHSVLSGAEVWRADQLPGEESARSRLRRLQDSVHVRPAAEHSLTSAENPALRKDTLRAMTYRAHEGDPEGRAGVVANARSWLQENLCKFGQVLTITAHIAPDGQVVQNGQITTDRQRNTLEWLNPAGEMRQGVEAEGLNALRFEEALARGLLKGKKFVELSPVLSNTGRQELHDAGFYLDSMTCMIRMTEADDAGNCTMTTAMVGGVDQELLPSIDPQDPDASEVAREERALNLRFDLDVIRDMYALFGVQDVDKLSATELLAMPLIVSGEFDVIDFVMLYDILATTRLDGVPVFFGLTDLGKQFIGKTPGRADYLRHITERQAQQEQLEPLAEAIADELIARRAEAATPLETINLLSEIGLDHVIARSATDHSMDIRTFGVRTLVVLEQARAAIAAGDTEQAKRSLQKARDNARDTSCPTGQRQQNAEAQGADGKDGEEGDGKPKKMCCPFCSAVVFADPCAKILSCWDCKAFTLNGKVVYKGDGGSKARIAAESERRAKHQTPEQTMAHTIGKLFSAGDVALIEAEETAAKQDDAPA